MVLHERFQPQGGRSFGAREPARCASSRPLGERNGRFDCLSEPGSRACHPATFDESAARCGQENVPSCRLFGGKPIPQLRRSFFLSCLIPAALFLSGCGAKKQARVSPPPPPAI